MVPAADGGPNVDIEATYGLLLRNGVSWDWVCHEAVTSEGALLSPRYSRSAAEVWLSTVSDVDQGRDGQTLFRSVDGACTWDPVTGLDGQVVAAAQFNPADPSVAWAVTAAPDGASAIFQSTDSGASWTEDTLAPGRHFHRLQVEPQAAFASATNLGGTSAFLWHRPAGGIWTEKEVPLPPNTEAAKLMLLDAVGADRAWVVVDRSGNDLVLRTDDAGATWVEVFAPEGDIVDGATDGTGLWVTVNGLELIRIDAGVVSAAIVDFPLSFGMDTVGDALYLAPRSYLVGPLLSRGTPDGAFETLAYPDDIVGPKVCPPGSTVAEVCAPVWENLVVRLRGFDEPLPDTSIDSGEPLERDKEPDLDRTTKGCGCATEQPSFGPWLLSMFRRR